MSAHRVLACAAPAHVNAREPLKQTIEAGRTWDALHLSEERLRLAIEAAGMFTWDGDLVAGTISWSDNTAAVLGCRPEELPDEIQNGAFFIAPEDAPRVVAQHAQALERKQERYSLEFRGRGSAGSTRYFQTQARIIYAADGTPLRVVGVTYDVTRHRRTEKRLRESEARLAQELTATSRLHALSSRLLHATDLTIALDDVLEDAIRSCGADFGSIQLLDPDTGALELVAQRGHSPEFLDHFRSVRADDGSTCSRAMQTRERVVIEDVLLDPAYQPHLDVAAASGYRAAVSTPFLSHGGILVGMLSVHFREPGGRSERDLRLLDLYARNAADLIVRVRMEQAMRDADRRKNEFLAVLAHELRNPLAPILNAVQILKENTVANPDATWSQAVIERQVAHMARLLDDLLDVNRITRNRLELRRCTVTLSTVVQSALETSRPVLDQSQHRLTITLPDTPVFVNADPVRLAQVFANLLNNAARYTPAGGRIDVSAWTEDAGDGTDEMVVSVKDSGIGIEPRALPHVFEMFAQAESGAGRLQGGLGIGLSLAKGLIEMHGGRIEARSAGLGHGSEFVVRLPAERTGDLPHSAPPRDGGGSASERRYRLLVVDDVVDTADSLAAVMRARGHEVHTAYDGAEAVTMAERYRPEVVVLDLGMPTLTGYDAARLIRKAPWGRDMILIAVTGWGQERDRRRTKAAGFDRHLVKPVHPETLLDVLASLDALRKVR